MTAVAGNIFKASEFNTYVRDNLMETGPALAQELGNGYFFVTTGENSLSPSAIRMSSVNTEETTTSTTYTDLTTVGPTLAGMNVNSKVLLSFGARLSNNPGVTISRMSVEWSNDSGVVGAASDTRAVSNSAVNPYQIGTSIVVDTAPGTYTFTCKYRVTGGTGTFHYRNLSIFPF